MARDLYGNIIKTDIFGNKKSKKQIKRDIIAENRAKGQVAERTYVMRAQMSGYEVERTGRGSDFRVRKRHPLTGRVVYSGLREVKSSKSAPVSKLQQKTKKKKSNYKVIREEPLF
ncbi:MAG: hypothetical protein V1847_00270 [Candidatus Diapherotrites archaeon]